MIPGPVDPLKQSVQNHKVGDGGWGMEGFWRLKKRKKIPQLRVKSQRTYFMQPFLNLTIPSVFIGSKLSDLINYLQNKNRIYFQPKETDNSCHLLK